MKYYCIGIKGTGMSTLAQILYDLGNEVSGYDDEKKDKFTQIGLEERNIPIYYDSNHQLDKDTIVTHSMAIQEDHKELQRVKKLGLTIKKYSEIVGSVIAQFDSISVAGTHGKTTTSSLIRHILEESVGCSYFIGAGEGHIDKKTPYFVIESDEYNKHFLDYHPKYAIITNMEEEHMECYKDLDDIISSFGKFSDQTKEFVVACGDNINVRNMKTKTKIYYYGVGKDNDIIIKNVNLTKKGNEFDLFLGEKNLGHFVLPLFGMPMIYNATAAIFVCYQLGVSLEQIQKALLTFQNAKRRFAEEVIGETIIIDDYAHHPTEIKTTLEAARQKYPEKTLSVVFKPNTYSRTEHFAKEFAESLKIADHIYLTEIDCNREKQEDYPNVSSDLILNYLPHAEKIKEENNVSILQKERGNVVCFMSCASTEKLIEAFKLELQK